MSCDSQFSSYLDMVCTPSSAAVTALGGDPQGARGVLTTVLDIARTRGAAAVAGEGKLTALTQRAAQALAREQVIALFRDIEAANLTPPAHGDPDPSLGFPLPKDDALAGYAAVQETIMAARGGQPLPILAQQVRFSQTPHDDRTSAGNAHQAFLSAPSLIAFAERLATTRTPQNDVEATTLALADGRPMPGRGIWLFNRGEFDLALDVLGEVDSAPDVDAAIGRELRFMRDVAAGRKSAGFSSPERARAYNDRIERATAARNLAPKARR